MSELRDLIRERSADDDKRARRAKSEKTKS